MGAAITGDGEGTGGKGKGIGIHPTSGPLQLFSTYVHSGVGESQTGVQFRPTRDAFSSQLRANVTSSTKPEVHNLSQRR